MHCSKLLHGMVSTCTAKLEVTGKNVAMTAGMTRGLGASIKRRDSDPLRKRPPRTRPLPAMDTITYRAYSGEHELPYIISLVQGELSEPYVVYTYRYFLHQWSATPFSLTPHRLMLTSSFSLCRPHLSFLVRAPTCFL